MMGPKVKIFVFRYVCLVSRICGQNSSPGSLAFSHLGNRAAHVKRPLVWKQWFRSNSQETMETSPKGYWATFENKKGKTNTFNFW